MKYKTFIKLLSIYKEAEKELSELYDIGIDFYEGKYSLSDKFFSFLETTFKSYYTKEGWEWVGWYIFENEWGEKVWGENLKGKTVNDLQKTHGAVDKDGNPIAYSFLSLWELLEKDYKNK